MTIERAKRTAYSGIETLSRAYEQLQEALKKGADPREIADAACRFADECDWIRGCFVNLETEAINTARKEA